MQNKDSKKRYKMYKAGKNWVVAPLVFLGLAIGAHTSQQDASADTTTPADGTQATTAGNDTNVNNGTQQGTVKLQTVQQNTNTTQAAPVQQAPVQDQAAQTAIQVVQQAATTVNPAQQPTVQQNVQRVTPINTPTNASQKLVNNKWYLVDNETGKNLNGFQEIKDQNKVVYYSPKNNQMQYGWNTINNNQYYFDKLTGAMTTGQKNIDGSWYLFNNSGVMQKGFQEIKYQNKTVYYSNSGKMQYGQQNINGNWYLFNSLTGAMQKGFQYISNQKKIVHYDENSGIMDHGWKTLNNNVYYFDKYKGSMAKGQLIVDGSWRLFDVYGVMKTGFQRIPEQNKTVYYDQSGRMQYGQQRINGAWYLFDKMTGAMKTGFQRIPEQNKTVYYNQNGKMQYGWKNISGNSYYFDKLNGSMYTGVRNINGKEYKFGNDGRLENGNTWGWPFPSIGQGSFTGAQLFGKNPGGGFRTNGFHDGLDFGSYDHPGSSVHAVHGGTVTRVSYTPGLEHYVVVKSDDGYNIVYQEAFSNRGNIKVSVGQKIKTGDVIGYRNTSHLHLGITREQNIDKAIANSFNNNGTWLDPLSVIKNGIANQK